MLEIKKAERTQLKLRLAITGPSGSGKTYSALKIASGLGKRVLLVDTENHSSTTYADEFDFDIINMDPPYTIPKYIEAIRMAVAKEYEVLVLDSISHAWAGEGGLLEKKNALDLSGRGNTYTNWASITKEQEQFKGLLLNCNIHLIATMRSKQDYVLEVNDNGKQVPKKVGMAPIQRDGMDYEFGVVLDMDVRHEASVTKTRLKFLDGKKFIPTEEIGQQLKQWLQTGKHVEIINAEEKAATEGVTEIENRLAAHCGGDIQAMNAQLILLTEYKQGAETKFISLEDLPMLAKVRPEWIGAIKKKMDAAGVK